MIGMDFLLTALLPVFPTMTGSGLFFYRRASIGRRAAHTLLRGVAAAVSYVFIYLAAMLVMGGVYLAFDWYSGGITAARLQGVALVAFSTVASTLVATVPWKQVKS